MHISEGVLSGPLLISGIAIAGACTVAGLKKLDFDQIAKAGILSASFFVASLVHIPIGPASIHLILNGIVGLLLGWSAFPVILVALILQGVIFQYGGITILGVNTVIMALPAVICYYIFSPFLHKQKGVTIASAFVCGFISVLLSGILVAVALMFTEENFLNVAKLILISHIPVMIIEGIITAFCVLFLKKVQPFMLPGYLNTINENGTKKNEIKFFIPVFCLLMILFNYHLAYCHKIIVFAWIEGKTVHTECKFSGGKKVKQGKIEVFDLKGKKLLEGTTDNKGEFSFPVPGKFSFEIFLNATTGHKGKWTVPEEKILEVDSNDHVHKENEIPQMKPTPVSSTIKNDDELVRLVDKAVDKKLKQAIVMLRESSDKTSFRDIIGGIGYIIGLLGLAAYINYRKKNK